MSRLGFQAKLADLLQEVGKDLRRRRTARGLTQGALADLAGVCRATICLIENGKANPTLETLLWIDLTLHSAITEKEEAPCESAT